jgi:adenylate kinase
MPGTIIVAGIPGVGKTTILHELELVAREKNVALKIINFGNVMNELFQKRGKQIHRDHMRREDIDLQSRIQQQAARAISRMPGKSALVVDTHMFVKTTDGIWPGTPLKVLQALNPDMIILIEADPVEISGRRKSDSSRYRDGGSVEDATSDLQWSRYMASANAVLAGVPIQIVHNRDGKQRETAEEILNVIQKRN